MTSYKTKLKEWADRRKKIVSLRDDDKLTFAEIAKIYGITHTRVLQIYYGERGGGKKCGQKYWVRLER